MLTFCVPGGFISSHILVGHWLVWCEVAQLSPLLAIWGCSLLYSKSIVYWGFEYWFQICQKLWVDDLCLQCLSKRRIWMFWCLWDPVGRLSSQPSYRVVKCRKESREQLLHIAWLVVVEIFCMSLFVKVYKCYKYKLVAWCIDGLVMM